MPHAVSMPSPGLHALILCGPGSSFPTFTANPDENPKALIPIANRPMVWYPLDFCYRTGITNITLICPPSASKAITAALNTNPHLTSLPLPRPDVLAPDGLNYNTGTAEILRLPKVQSKIQSDFIVLPCDLVCELGGEKLLQTWMITSASLPQILGDEKDNEPHSGGLGVWYETKKSVKGEETDFIMTSPLPTSATSVPKGSLVPHLSNLVYSIPTDSLKDLTEERRGFPVRHGLLRKFPRVRMLTTHRDAHIYIFPKWVMDLVKENPSMESIGEDVIGWWAKAGWQEGLHKKLGLEKIFHGEDDDGASSHSFQEDHSPSPNATISTGGRASGSPSSRSWPGIMPQILAYVHPSRGPQEPGPVIRRVDTSQLLLAVSLQLAKLPALDEYAPDGHSPFAHARKVAYPEGVKPRTTITKVDSLVGENVTVDEKTSIKESVVGANCQIQESAKLMQCLLMDGVVIGKGCKLTRCVIGKRAEIGAGCVLTDCEIQENLLVEAKTDEKDHKFMSSEGLEATEEELQMDLDEEGIGGGTGLG